MNTSLRFTAAELEVLLRAALPLRIDLSNPEEGQRTLDVESISSVTLLPTRGIQAIGHVKVEWPVLGIQIPATVDDLELHVLLSLSGQGADAVLRVQFEIQAADIRNVPGFIEKPVIAKVNDALASDGATITWGLGKTFGTSVALPKLIQPQRKLGVAMSDATLAITGDALELQAAILLSITT